MFKRLFSLSLLLVLLFPSGAANLAAQEVALASRSSFEAGLTPDIESADQLAPAPASPTAMSPPATATEPAMTRAPMVCIESAVRPRAPSASMVESAT